MKKILGILVVAIIGVGLFIPGVCFADKYCDRLRAQNITSGAVWEANKCDLTDDPSKVIGDKVTRPINTLLYIVGVLAVVMVIYGGFTYMTSTGDAAKVHKGKTILIYSLVGLAIAVLAYAIINFVIMKV